MINYQRNPEELKVAIREHTIHGYPIKVPTFGKALGVQTSTSRDITGVLVDLDHPMPFDEMAEKYHWSQEKWNLKEWRENLRPYTSSTTPEKMLPEKIQTMLEQGKKISKREVQRETYLANGWLDQNGNLIRFSFPINQVSMDPTELEPGMIVEFLDGSSRESGLPGRVIGIGKDPQDDSRIIYLETFEPVPALMAPKATSPWLLEPGFVPDRTWVLGYGTLKAMEMKGMEIPKGMYDPKDAQKRLYYLDQPMPLATIRAFCENHYPKSPECVWNSIVMMVLPLHPATDPKGRHQGGIFRPYPDDTRTTEIEAQIDYFGEGTEFED